jgi:hypothetical protein
MFGGLIVGSFMGWISGWCIGWMLGFSNEIRRVTVYEDDYPQVMAAIGSIGSGILGAIGGTTAGGMAMITRRRCLSIFTGILFVLLSGAYHFLGATSSNFWSQGAVIVLGGAMIGSAISGAILGIVGKRAQE